MHGNVMVGLYIIEGNQIVEKEMGDSILNYINNINNFAAKLSKQLFFLLCRIYKMR